MYKIWKTFRFTWKYGWKKKPFGFVLLTVITFLIGLLLVAGTWITKAAVDALGQRDLSWLLLAPVLLALFLKELGLNCGYSGIMPVLENKVRQNTVQSLAGRMYRKIGRLPVGVREQEAVQERIGRAERFLNQEFAMFQLECAFIFRLLVTCLGAALSLAYWSVWFPVITIGLVIPVILIRLKNNENLYRINQRQQRRKRRNDYLCGLFFDRSALGELSATGAEFPMIDTVEGTAKELTEERYARKRIFIRKPREAAGKRRTDIVNRFALEVNDLTFAYPASEGKPVLKNVSFTLGDGETIAFVGPNGGGKSTLISLLLGLYPLDSGEIRIYGRPVNEISWEQGRKCAAVFFQSFLRYETTVKDNIVLGNIAQADNQELMGYAARLSTAETFFDRLKNGVDTKVGSVYEGAVNLSGGQWQRLAVARGFFADTPLLFLDEPNAAVDPVTEVELFHHYREGMKGKGGIIVSHRLAALQKVDRILVLEAGEIVEQGSHNELMERKGLYYEMYLKQKNWTV